MKKILLFSVIILMCSRCFAQTSALTVTNNAPIHCDITVAMFASASYSVSALCGQYESNSFVVAGGGGTMSWCSAYDFQTGVVGGGVAFIAQLAGQVPLPETFRLHHLVFSGMAPLLLIVSPAASPARVHQLIPM